MSIKYISGSDGFGFPWGSKPNSPITKDDYTIGAINLIGNQLWLPRIPLFDEHEDMKPILGLGLRKAFLKGWSSGTTLKIDLATDISTITELEKNMIENKAGAAVLGVAGMALAGPVGILAGLAAKKKGEVMFAMELRNNCKESLLNGKVIVLSAEDKDFQKIRQLSNAPSKAAKEFISNQSSGHEDSMDSISAEIDKLSKLKDSGALSEEEFAAAKAKLLGL